LFDGNAKAIEALATNSARKQVTRSTLLTTFSFILGAPVHLMLDIGSYIRANILNWVSERNHSMVF
jgi:hypothetical protein